MPIAPPALVLKMRPNLLAALVRNYRQGKSIPPKWLDSNQITDKKLWSYLGLKQSNQASIENTIEHAMYYHLQKKHAYTKRYETHPTWASKHHLEDRPFFKPTQRFDFTTSVVFDLVDAELLHELLNFKLREGTQGIEVMLTAQQLAQIYPDAPHLMYLHGNQTLTGAPYIIGGVPHVDFFQWGNLLGVIKYQELDSEKAENANLLIHFESMQDMDLEERINLYQQHQLQLIQPVIIKPELPPPAPLWLTPRLTLTPSAKKEPTQP